MAFSTKQKVVEKIPLQVIQSLRREWEALNQTKFDILILD